ncbi:hypothetical protein SAMN04488109_2978 [Chryseolinea serpens]|uniref:Uncharacterized protein n=1 Tax=Chryseolinea serpens TaxID=947013 RepID=A0A1M5QT68_9BACT|nr:hypothetical protein [Chryseolinea serpens]SHH16793.1 hypothetical protein SAMN04488109_2978 [Chryseolinea serpens]
MTPVHQFHIPVMGLAFTIDSPIKVARYGIASTISIIEDKLVELMRAHYYKERREVYEPITTKQEDYRARRITDYLNLVHRIVQEQMEKLKASAFEKGSEISKYMEMLPSKSALRKAYEQMLVADGPARKAMQNYLRTQIVAGAIDVNIMTKVDRDNPGSGGKVVQDSSDAVTALRGYANSVLTNSSIVFSAGMNPRLFSYLERLPEFDAKGFGVFNKKVVIKVSDYRSALIQGKFLAKKGVWVSEFRIESGLNCGGHAFATDGSLMGPILEEFKTKREELAQALFHLYKPVAEKRTGLTFTQPHPLKITVQGGVGTHEEAEFLRETYDIESVGWGTPFLLCPEATTVDADTLQQLAKAKADDVILSKNSPLGVRFNYLKGTSSEKEKMSRIANGKPGSPCTEKFLVSNTEFTKEPICTASHKYQKLKIEQLKSLELSVEEYEKQYREVVSKECLCIGLSNSAIREYQLPPVKGLTAVTTCPGPNIAYFDKIVTLQEMTDHIYGRTNILDGQERPHMFIKELTLNVAYMKEQLSALKKDEPRSAKDILDFSRQLLLGIEYYHALAGDIKKGEEFNDRLDEIEKEIKDISVAITGQYKE